MRYEVTVNFEVSDDEQGSIKKAIETEGIESVQHDLAMGFADPEFSNIKCTVSEIVEPDMQQTNLGV